MFLKEDSYWVPTLISHLLGGLIRVVLDYLVGPITELDGLLIFDFEAYAYNRLLAIVLRLVVFAIGGSC